MSKDEFTWREDDDLSSFNSLNIETSPSDPFLKNASELFNVLTDEEEQITKNLPILISKLPQKQDQIDLLEAFSLELKIRNQEKHQLLDSLVERERAKAQQIHELQMQIKSLKDDIARNSLSTKKRSDRVAGYTSAIDMYDWVVDIPLLTDISKTGWEVEFSQKFMNMLEEEGKGVFNLPSSVEEQKEPQSLHGSFALEKCETKAGPGA